LENIAFWLKITTYSGGYQIYSNLLPLSSWYI